MNHSGSRRSGMSVWALAVAVATIGTGASAEDQPRVLVGAARVDVTPTVPVVLAGYGGRTKEYEGIDTKLWARAMVIGDAKPVVIVALDNCGVPQSATDRLAERLQQHGIPKSHLVVAATHTHNAPTLVDYAPIVWQGRTTAEQDERTAQYTTFAIEQMEKAIVQALENRQPMTLEWAQGRVGFGGNRRVMTGGVYRGFGLERSGLVDHSLPVLAARDAQGTVRAVWANYACHCTTVGGRNFVGGDWAGYANKWMEKKFPQAVSLMSIGCGADVGPVPSGGLQDAELHGRTIAEEVARLLDGETTPLSEAPRVASKRIKLPLEEPQGREQWEAQARGRGFHAQLAKSMLKRLDETGSLPREVDYPMSVWTFGDDLAMVFLAGEVVVDYSVRLKSELDWQRLWVTAWVNDVPGYIPSRRVLLEGGYEADFSQVYYNQPSRYEPGIEAVLVASVKELVGERFATAKGAAADPFHHVADGFRWIPTNEKVAFSRLAARAAAEKDEHEAKAFEAVRAYLQVAQPAVGEGKIAGVGIETAHWNNFAGDHVSRTFIRQSSPDAELRWSSPTVADRSAPSLVFCFSGGMGWQGQPVTDGFALFVGEKRQLTFDLTRGPSRWTSEDGTVELLYLPTWESDADTGGFFFVACSKPSLNDAGRVSFAVRSLGEGSQRWFAVDNKQDMPARLKKLRTAIGSQTDSSKTK